MDISFVRVFFLLRLLEIIRFSFCLSFLRTYLPRFYSFQLPNLSSILASLIIILSLFISIFLFYLYVFLFRIHSSFAGNFLSLAQRRWRTWFDLNEIETRWIIMSTHEHNATFANREIVSWNLWRLRGVLNAWWSRYQRDEGAIAKTKMFH